MDIICVALHIMWRTSVLIIRRMEGENVWGRAQSCHSGAPDAHRKPLRARQKR